MAPQQINLELQHMQYQQPRGLAPQQIQHQRQLPMSHGRGSASNMPSWMLQGQAPPPMPSQQVPRPAPRFVQHQQQQMGGGVVLLVCPNVDVPATTTTTTNTAILLLHSARTKCRFTSTWIAGYDRRWWNLK